MVRIFLGNMSFKIKSIINKAIAIDKRVGMANKLQPSVLLEPQNAHSMTTVKNISIQANGEKILIHL